MPVTLILGCREQELASADDRFSAGRAETCARSTARPRRCEPSPLPRARLLARGSARPSKLPVRRSVHPTFPRARVCFRQVLSGSQPGPGTDRCPLASYTRQRPVFQGLSAGGGVSGAGWREPLLLTICNLRVVVR